MVINPGEFNKSISIINPGTGKDSDGYPANTRTTVLSCKAKFSRTSGTEGIKSNADFANISVRFVIRYPKATITRKMLVEYGGVDYEIDYVNDYEDAHKYMEIIARRVVTA